MDRLAPQSPGETDLGVEDNMLADFEGGGPRSPGAATTSGTNILRGVIQTANFSEENLPNGDQMYSVNSSSNNKLEPNPRLTRTRTYSTAKCDVILAAVAVIICYIFVFSVALIGRNMLPSPRMAADTPRTEFSAGRALVYLEKITQRRHSWNTAANFDVGVYIASQVDRIQKKYPQSVDFTVDDQAMAPNAINTAINATAIRYYPSRKQVIGAAVKSKSIVARLRKGADPSKSLLLSAHYDSAAVSYGAFDDGIAIAIMLEVRISSKFSLTISDYGMHG